MFLRPHVFSVLFLIKGSHIKISCSFVQNKSSIENIKEKVDNIIYKSQLEYFIYYCYIFFVCQEMIDEADRDGDGEINEIEFLRVMKKTSLY